MKVKFKEIALMLSGVYMKTDPSGDIGYWQIKDVSKENGFNYEQLSMVVDNGKISNYLLRPGDLLFSSKGLSNYCVMYHGEGGKTMASSSFILIRLKDLNQVLPEFICYYLNSLSVLDKLRSAAVGTTIQIIPQSVLGELELTIPTIEIQRIFIEIERLQKRTELVYSEMIYKKKILLDHLLMEIVE